MSEEINELERLISRYLDGECSPAQRCELEERIARDAGAAELFEEYAGLDRQLQAVLRETVLRPEAPRLLPVRWWERGARVAILAAAACLAVLFWFSPPERTDTPKPSRAEVQHSWFATSPYGGDTLVRSTASVDEPVTWVSKPQTDWIVIPTEQPEEFLVIQVDSIETQTSRDFQDF